MKILIVDDNHFILDFFTDLLDYQGYTITTASSVKKATKIIKEEDFNMAIIDFSMPDGNGAELVRLIKEQKPIMKIIGISSLEIAELFYDAGVDYFLRKPFTVEKILKVIRSLN